MPNKLSTTVKKIDTVPNPTNSALIRESYKYMRENDASERNQNNSLMVVIAFAKFFTCRYKILRSQKQGAVHRVSEYQSKEPRT